MTPAEQLAMLAERELVLVRDGRLDELEDLHRAREGLVGKADPREAAFARAVAVQALVTAALREQRDLVLGELVDVAPRRRAVQAYGASTNV